MAWCADGQPSGKVFETWISKLHSGSDKTKNYYQACFIHVESAQSRESLSLDSASRMPKKLPGWSRGRSFPVIQASMVFLSQQQQQQQQQAATAATAAASPASTTLRAGADGGDQHTTSSANKPKEAKKKQHSSFQFADYFLPVKLAQP